jgi:hypothetical protein
MWSKREDGSHAGTAATSDNQRAAGPGKHTLTEALPPVQRQADSAGHPVQQKADGGSQGDVMAAAQHGVSGTPEALPHRDRIQGLFGHHDVSGIQAHVGGPAAEASQQIGASAYATGSSVAFREAPDLHTAAHEAAHVVQQREGVQLRGGVGEAGDAYERHADAVADAVVAGKPAGGILDQMVGGGSHSPAVQRIATGPAGEGPNTVKGGGATQTPASSKTYAQITAGKISELVSYSDQQADWSMQIADATQQANLRTLMTWLRAKEERQTALNGFNVGDVIAVKGELPALDAYSRARGTTTVQIDPAATIADAVSIGHDVVKLEGACPPAQLHQIFPPKYYEWLRSEGKVDMFVSYVKTCKPMLQANNGREIQSFIELATVRDPATFKDVKDVRSFHRFQEPALVALRAAQGGNPTNKPFTLILHSAFDWNGAFHQDPELTRAIVAGSNHTIMIEGAESLDAIAAHLPAIVALHGRDEPDKKDPKKKVKRIDQVMLAGHGSAHSIELAGDLAKDKAGNVETDTNGLKTNDDSLDLTKNAKDPASVKRAKKTEDFMKTVMGYMAQDPATPHGRIVFNACLTASNEIDPATIDEKKSPADQAKQMKAQIAKSPSLVEEMRKIAKDTGHNTDVRGGNGSFGRVGLIDGTGGLDIVADGTSPTPGMPRDLDAELTNPDKLVYAEKGADPQGCMSAVAESWAKDAAKTITAVQDRRKAPNGTGWDETVIQALYQIVETRYAANGAKIVELASVTDGFKELASEGASRPWTMWRLADDKDWGIVEASFKPHASWTGQPFAPLVFYEAWYYYHAAKEPAFLAALGAMTVRTSKDFLYMDGLYTKWGTLVPAASGKPPDAGRLRLALRDVTDAGDKAKPHTKSFLGSLVTAHAFTVDVNTPLDGLGTDDSVLRALGLHASQAAGKGKAANPKAPAPDANVDMDKDGKNESVVEAMSAIGKVTAQELHVRDQPTTKGKDHPTTLKKGDQVDIMGQVDTWYLIDHAGVRGYSAKQYIEIV